MDYMHAIADVSQPRKTKHLISNLARKFQYAVNRPESQPLHITQLHSKNLKPVTVRN
jgi:hypothetical protein